VRRANLRVRTEANDYSSEIKLPTEIAVGFCDAPTRFLPGEGQCLGGRNGACTLGAAGIEVLTRGERSAEITSGRAYAQQGFTTTCMDWYFERKHRVTEGIGLAHESVER
jgi:hypothetical protein